jgi:hypothetical protein
VASLRLPYVQDKRASTVQTFYLCVYANMQGRITKNRIEALRRMLLGPALYKKCGQGEGAQQDDLNRRLIELKNSNCVTGDCSVDDLVKMCSLKESMIPLSQTERMKLVGCYSGNTMPDCVTSHDSRDDSQSTRSFSSAYGDALRIDDSEGFETCSICLDDLVTDESEQGMQDRAEKGAVVSLDCNHSFHANCVAPAVRKRTCPICRKWMSNEEVSRIMSGTSQPSEPAAQEADDQPAPVRGRQNGAIVLTGSLPPLPPPAPVSRRGQELRGPLQPFQQAEFQRTLRVNPRDRLGPEFGDFVQIDVEEEEAIEQWNDADETTRNQFLNNSQQAARVHRDKYLTREDVQNIDAYARAINNHRLLAYLPVVVRDDDSFIDYINNSVRHHPSDKYELVRNLINHEKAFFFIRRTIIPALSDARTIVAAEELKRLLKNRIRTLQSIAKDFDFLGLLEEYQDFPDEDMLSSDEDEGDFSNNYDNSFGD